MFETKEHEMFSALIKRPNRGSFWTPKFSGAEKKAQEYLATQKDAVECSLYLGQRFVKTVRRKSDK
jgi:hypothetical protein|tara:strand:- start:365 stop:562 length:198 start_codon:yes stop_codon:yes gene_type:complete